jgi:hypothetical protein
MPTTTRRPRSRRSPNPSDEPTSEPAARPPSPTPSASPPPGPEPLVAAPPGFRQPTPPSPPSLEDGAPVDEPPEPPGLDEPPASSTRASTRDVATLSGALVGVIATGVGFVSLALHAWRTPGDANAVWLATETEMQDIAAPLSRIVARRLPAGLASGDAGDAAQALTATAAYTARNAVEEVAYRRGARGAAVPAADAGEEAATTPPAAGEWPPNGVNPLEHMGRA